MRFSILLPAWLLVLIGLLMNVVAILVSGFVVDKHAMRQHDLYAQQQDNVYAIQQVWNKLDILERKEEVLLLYLASTNRQDVLSLAMAQQLAPWLDMKSVDVSLASMPGVLKALAALRQQQRDRIDDLYISNLRLQDMILGHQQQHQFYRNIALLLQIMGLVLILARDFGSFRGLSERVGG